MNSPTSTLADQIFDRPAAARQERTKPYRVVVGLPDWTDLSAAIQHLGPDVGNPDVVAVANAGSLTEIREKALAFEADAVLLSPLLPGFKESGAEIIQLLYHHDPLPIVTLGVVPPGSGDWPQTLHDLGARGYIVGPLREDAVARLVDLLRTQVPLADQERTSVRHIPYLDRQTAAIVDRGGWQRQTIAVWSAKGGVGKTFLAVNLAVLLGVVANKFTVLVDADMAPGEAHLWLGGVGDRDHTIFQLAQDFASNGRQLTPNMVKPYLAPYQGNLHVLRAVVTPTWGGMPELTRQGAEFMHALLNTLQQLADFVVIDPGLSYTHPVPLTALHRADLVLVVVTPAIASPYRLHGALEPLRREMEIDPARFKLVFNRYNPHLGTKRKDVVDVLKLPEFAVLSQDVEDEVDLSQNAQEPLVLRYPKLELTREVVALATNFYPPLRDIWARYGTRGVRPRPGLGHLLRQVFRRQPQAAAT